MRVCFRRQHAHKMQLLAEYIAKNCSRKDSKSKSLGVDFREEAYFRAAKGDFRIEIAKVGAEKTKTPAKLCSNEARNPKLVVLPLKQVAIVASRRISVISTTSVRSQ